MTNKLLSSREYAAFVVELKTRIQTDGLALPISATGKMDFYLNLLNEKERGAGDNPSIGIILCAENWIGIGFEIGVNWVLRQYEKPCAVGT